MNTNEILRDGRARTADAQCPLNNAQQEREGGGGGEAEGCNITARKNNTRGL